MKCVLISDTHYSELSTPGNLRVLQELEMDPPEVLFHAGDWISTCQSELEQILSLYDVYLPNTRIIAVRGNHDFWDGQFKYPTLDELLDSHVRLFAQYGVELLQGNWIELAPGISVGGFDGWYGDPFPPTNDVYYMPRDTEVHDRFARRAGTQLHRLLDNPPAGIRIGLTHFPAFSESPRYLNLCANTNYHAPLVENLDFLLLGHSHQRVDQFEGRCRILNAGSDYGKPRYIRFDVPGRS